MQTEPVIRFDLSPQELDLLAEMLESELAKLAVEIRHTDKRTYREELKQRFEMVEDMLARIH